MVEVILAKTIAKNIAAGHYDKELDRIANAIRSREQIVRQQRAAAMAATLQVGDKVILPVTAKLGPKYLLGREGVVDEPPVGKRIMVDFGEPIGRYSAKIRVPLDCLETL